MKESFNTMARLYGFELKNVKTWNGMEGYGLQADVWFKHKRIGVYTDEGNGGSAYFSFQSIEFDKAIAKECPDLAWDFNGEHLNGDLTLLFSRLIDMIDLEKTWKRNVKNGYPSTAVITSGLMYCAIGMLGTDENSCLKELAEYLKNGKIALPTGYDEYEAEVYCSADVFSVGEPLHVDVTPYVDELEQRESVYGRISR